jgi:hypothetical protein
MPLPNVVTLARRVAALTSHHGPDDPRTLAALSEWRVAKLLQEIEALAAEERARLLAALTAHQP